MKFTRNRRNRRNKRNRRHTRKGGAPKTMKDNLSNCALYWKSYNDTDKCSQPFDDRTNIRPFDIINYPGRLNKMMGKKPTWLPETSTTGLAQNIRFSDDKKFMEKNKSRLQIVPYAEVPKELY